MQRNALDILGMKSIGYILGSPNQTPNVDFVISLSYKISTKFLGFQLLNMMIMQL